MQLESECPNYVATHYFPGEVAGSIVKGYRNENLEDQEFDDRSIDVAISLDVMEHVNDPERAFKETARTLKVGGCCIFTAPTYVAKAISERRARIGPDGKAAVLVGKAEYHGNPISDQGALVTFHYGYDLPELITRWTGMGVEVLRFNDPYHGIIGPMTEVYVCRKRER